MLLLVLGVGAYALYQQQTAQRYTDAEVGIAFVMPAGWLVAEEKGSRIVIESPDLERDELAVTLDAGEGSNPVKKGGYITYGGSNQLPSSITNAEEYVDFTLKPKENCDNCISEKEIQIDGKPAVLSRSRFSNSRAGEPGDWISAGVWRNGKEFQITFYYGSFSLENERIFEDFLASFRFAE